MRKIKYQVVGWYIPPNLEERDIGQLLDVFLFTWKKESINWLFDIFLPNVCFLLLLLISLYQWTYFHIDYLVFLLC